MQSWPTHDRTGAVVALVRTALVISLTATAGCHWATRHGRWSPPQPPSLAEVRELQESWRRAPFDDCGVEQLVAAVEAENKGENAAAIYYQAALASGRCLSSDETGGPSRCIAAIVHQASVKGMLASSSTKMTPGECLIITGDEGARVPISLHGFAWDASAFQNLQVVESYRTESLSRVHRRAGVGVPVVLERRQRTGTFLEERFLPAPSTFAATVVLRPHAPRSGPPGASGPAATLEFYNPHEFTHIEYGRWRLPLAADLSAPLAYQAISESSNRRPLDWFLDPGAARGDEGLFFLEPYQPGKIPIVLVHGLLSSPSTWTDLANDLRATPDFDQHYQIWAYRYATGKSFLRSSAALRRALYEATETLDPHGDDAALRSMVLVGHSMGGIVSKLQAVESRDVLWRSVAALPLERIVADEATRRELAEVLMFEPQPSVRRVLFLAVPHGGSSFATRPVGRLASTLARPDDEQSARHARLIADNPGVFAPQVERRLPTSIDMLEPANPILQAIRQLPLAPQVRAHSIIGTGGLLTPFEPGDGVVPVASATHPRVDSVMFVQANHQQVHRHEEAIDQVRAILRHHLSEFMAESALGNAQTRPIPR